MWWNPLKYIDSTGLIETETGCPPVCYVTEDLENYVNNTGGTGDIGVLVAPTRTLVFGAGIQINSNGVIPYASFGRQIGIPGVSMGMNGNGSPMTSGSSTQLQTSIGLLTRVDTIQGDGSTSTGYGGQMFTGPRSFIPNVSVTNVYAFDLPGSQIFQRLRRLSATMSTNHQRLNSGRSPYFIPRSSSTFESVRYPRVSEVGLPEIFRQERRTRLDWLMGTERPVRNGTGGRMTGVCDENGKNCEYF